MNIKIVASCLMLLTCRVLCRAGDFINLDFEHPDLSHATPDQIPGQFRAPTSEALQGWTLTADAISTETLYVTPAGAGRGPISLTGSATQPGVDFGQYRLYLANESLAPGSLEPIYHLKQSGTIPVGATELVYFRVGGSSPGGNPGAFKILINGQSVSYTESLLTPVAKADVSAFAGQQVNLEFVFPKGGSYFDIAGFNVVPEPSTYALLGLSAVALWWCRRRSNF